MLQLRSIDPAFPIEKQLALDVGPVVLVNIFTLDSEDEQEFLRVWLDDAEFMKAPAGVHLDATASSDWRKSDISELRRLGIQCSLPSGLFKSRFQKKAVGLPRLGDCVSAPLSKMCSPRHLSRMKVDKGCVVAAVVIASPPKPVTATLFDMEAGGVGWQLRLASTQRSSSDSSNNLEDACSQ